MPSTWAGTASNGLITRSALQDAVNTGYANLASGQSITGTTQICTKSYLAARLANVESTRTAWAALASTECPTKAELQAVLKRNVSIWASAASGLSYTLTFKRKPYDTSTVSTVGTNTINSTTCTNLYMLVGATVGDTLYFEFSTGLYPNIQGVSIKNSQSCGSGSLACSPHTYTIGTDETIEVSYAFKVNSIVSCL